MLGNSAGARFFVALHAVYCYISTITTIMQLFRFA